MPSGLVFNDKNNHFEAKYEYPWGGVNSDAAPMDIPSSSFAVVTGLNVKDGVLPTTTYSDAPLGTSGISSTYFVKVFNIGNNIYAFDYKGNAYGYDGTNFVLDQTCASAAGTVDVPEPSCIQVINGLVYAFNFTAGNVCVYTPGVSYVLGSDFVGGKYCCTLGEYLITANTNQPTDTPAIKQGRVNWSAPDAYTTWDPSIDRTSGFNVLTSVEDYISGVFALGNVGYVLRSQGLTQMTPTGVGIAPFDFTHLWASLIGIGCTMPATFSQYGNIAIWANDNNIYAFTGGSAPQEITGTAKAAIYADIYAGQGRFNHVVQTFVCGSFGNNSTSPAVVNSPNTPSPELEYTLAIITIEKLNSLYSITVTNWIYNIKSKTWMRTATPVALSFPGNLYYYDFQPLNINYASNFPRFISLLILGKQDNGDISPLMKLLSKYQATISTPANAPGGLQQFEIFFKQEEIRITRQPQIRGVAIKAVGNGILNVSVSGYTNGVLKTVSFTPVMVNSTNIQTYLSSGVYTGEDPQLRITAGFEGGSDGFDGVLIKASMFGTYADGEPF